MVDILGMIHSEWTSEDDIYVQAVTGLNQDILDLRPAAAPLRSFFLSLEIHWFPYTKLSPLILYKETGTEESNFW